MNKFIASSVSLACLALSTSAAQPVTTGKAAVVAPAETPIPKSVFEGDITTKKDPFFPNTKRGQKKVEIIHDFYDPNKEHVETPAPEASSFLTLKGILGTDGQRLALINTAVKNYEFAPGERLTVKIPEHNGKARTIVIKCLQITGDTVTVEISEGEKTESKELSFKK